MGRLHSRLYIVNNDSLSGCLYRFFKSTFLSTVEIINIYTLGPYKLCSLPGPCGHSDVILSPPTDKYGYIIIKIKYSLRSFVI